MQLRSQHVPHQKLCYWLQAGSDSIVRVFRNPQGSLGIMNTDKIILQMFQISCCSHRVKLNSFKRVLLAKFPSELFLEWEGTSWKY
jgi:hypothetical protein